MCNICSSNELEIVVNILLMNSQLLSIEWKNGSFNSWCFVLKSFFFLRKKRSKTRVRIIHGRALYTGKYSIPHSLKLKN